MMKLLIVDDHILFREGLAAIIGSEADIQIAGLAGSVQEAIRMAQETKPDVILMDIGLPDGSGPEAANAILAKQPECKIIFLTVYEDDENLFTAIRNGAKGYLLKNMRPAKLVAALRSVYQGESALSRSMTLRLMEELTRSKPPEKPGNTALAQLTQRERDVLRELASGKTNQQIACQLFLSENTIKYHVHSILDKLNISDRKAAAGFARDHGLAQ
jgi:two-component system, NarL family, response regulator LiaR